MDKEKTSWWQRHRPSTRRLIQVYSALLYNAHLKGFIEGDIYQGNTKAVCVPGFNCYSCPGAVGACPLGSIQNALASSGHRAGWYVLGIIMLYGVILGRTICGWICPVGLIQELLHKIPTPKIRKSRVTRALSRLKYVFLAVFVVAVPLWYGLAHDTALPAFCKYICPAGTLEGALGLMPARDSIYGMLSILFTRKYVIMVIIALICIFCYRSFCRFICPLGAIYGLFNRFSIVGVRVDADRCNHCGACVRRCGMDVRRVGDHECIQCGKCMDVCAQGAISLKAGKITLKGPEIGHGSAEPDAAKKRKKIGRVLWGIALAVLAFALVWFNFLDPSIREDETAEPAAAVTESVESPAPAETAAPEEAETEPEAETETETEAAASAESEAPASAAPEGTQAGETETQSPVSTAPIGYEVGQQLADFTAECYDGSTFRLADTRGKVVFINLWATWCGACVQELPYFDELYRAHEGEIAMLGVSIRYITDDPAAYVAEKGYAFQFTTDTDDAIFEIVNGSTTLPQTIVLNRKGEVIYNEQRSVTKEMLEALWEKANE